LSDVTFGEDDYDIVANPDEGTNFCIHEIAVLIPIEDVVLLRFQRTADDILGWADTFEGDIYLAGWIVEYTADS